MGSPEVSVDGMANNDSCFMSACGASAYPGGPPGLEIEMEPLGPPPDMILAIPPPPLPGFMEGALGRIGSLLANGSCDLCDWAAGSGVGYVELPRKDVSLSGMVIDDTWFLVILSSCLGITLLGIVLALFILKFRQQRLKAGLGTEVAANKPEKPLKGGKESSCVGDRCETVLYPTLPMGSSSGVIGMVPVPSLAPLPLPLPPRPSRALWAGIRTSPPNHYTIAHLQPVAQRKAESEEDSVAEEDALADYAYADYGSVGYTCLSPSLGNPNNGPMGSSSLHFLGDGHAYYSAEPDTGPTMAAPSMMAAAMGPGMAAMMGPGMVGSGMAAAMGPGMTAAMGPGMVAAMMGPGMVGSGMSGPGMAGLSMMGPGMGSLGSMEPTPMEGGSFENSGPGSHLQLSSSGLSPTGESFPLRAVGRSTIGRTQSTTSWSPRLSLDNRSSGSSHGHRHHHHHHPHHHSHHHSHRSRNSATHGIQVSSPTHIQNPNLPPLNLHRRGYSSSLGKKSSRTAQQRVVHPTAVTLGKNSTSTATTIVGRRPPSPLAPGMERSSSFVAISSPIV